MEPKEDQWWWVKDKATGDAEIAYVNGIEKLWLLVAGNDVPERGDNYEFICKVPSSEQIDSMQKRIVDLGVDASLDAKVLENGLTLMGQILDAIDYDESRMGKGFWDLPREIKDKMKEFVQKLHDRHDRHSPLIKD